MTFWDFIYIIGCGFAWMMLLFLFEKATKNSPNKENFSFGIELLAAGLLSFLSWSVPLLWLCHEIYERKFKK